MRREPSQYANCSPYKISIGSQAQMQFFVKDAKDDIADLLAQNTLLRENMRQNYDAFTAMRNDINELVGNMESQEGLLRHGPEMTHECAAVTEAVRAKIDELRGTIERVTRVDNNLAAQLRSSIENNAALKARAEQAEQRHRECQEHLARLRGP